MVPRETLVLKVIFKGEFFISFFKNKYILGGMMMNNVKVNSNTSTKAKAPTSDFGGREQINLNQTNSIEHLVNGMNFWGVGTESDDLSFFLFDSL